MGFRGGSLFRSVRLVIKTKRDCVSGVCNIYKRQKKRHYHHRRAFSEQNGEQVYMEGKAESYAHTHKHTSIWKSALRRPFGCSSGMTTLARSFSIWSWSGEGLDFLTADPWMAFGQSGYHLAGVEHLLGYCPSGPGFFFLFFFLFHVISSTLLHLHGRPLGNKPAESLIWRIWRGKGI
jgi:hypothetical protein